MSSPSTSTSAGIQPLATTSLTFTRSVSPAFDAATKASAPASTLSLDLLQHCVSISSLRVLLQALCSSHGQLQRLDIVPAARVGRRQALCFLRMQTAAQEHSLIRALGIGRFGGELVLVVNLASPEPEGDTLQGPTVSVSVLPVEPGQAQLASGDFKRWLSSASAPLAHGGHAH